MKIKIVTIREIDDLSFHDWISAVNMGFANGPISGDELLKHGKVTYTSTECIGLRKTSATTTYEIIQ